MLRRPHGWRFCYPHAVRNRLFSPDGPHPGTEGAPLPQRLGLGTATSVVVANMVGTGIFTTTGLMLARLECGWMVFVCWLVGGVVAACGALSYAELAVMMPRAGGEYVYLREIYGPLAGFLSGWISFFVGFSAPIAAAGVAITTYLSAAGVIPAAWPVEKGLAVGIVAALTAIHYRGLRSGALAQNVLTGLKLLLIGGLVAVGFAAGDGSWGFLAPGRSFWSGGRWSQVGIALLYAMFAYSGWNASAYIAEEVKRPHRNLPRSLLLGTLAVTIVYLAVNLLYFFAVPAADLAASIAVGEKAARHLFGPGAASALSILIGLSLLSSLSAYVLIGPRVYYAMARHHLFFRFAARIHPRFETPSASILLQGVCASLMILSGTFEQLLIYIGFALGIFPWMAVAGLFLLRWREPSRERPYRVWGYPLVPALYLLVGAFLLIAVLVTRPGPSLMALLTVAAGIPAYRLVAAQVPGKPRRRGSGDVL
jgi:APA family basic amino acid/polyamine antiporter